MNKSLSVILPCFNAEKFIEKKVKLLFHKLKQYKIKFEIILINDGSSDKTLEQLIKIKKKLKFIKIVNYKKNKGKSFITKSNMNKTKYKNVILIDCDLPYFQVFEKIIRKLHSGYDLVLVNRRHKKSKIKKEFFHPYQIIRYFIGNFIGKVSCYILNINIEGSDTQAGLKGIRKINNFDKIKFISNKFFLDLEIIFFYLKLKKKLFSVPVSYKIPNESSIKIFSIKNFNIVYELCKVIIYLIFNNKNLLKLKKLKNKKIKKDSF